jgi:hypothetical protein
MEKAAVFSYIRSKGLYAGIEITGTVSCFRPYLEAQADCAGICGEIRREWSDVSLEWSKSW